MNTIEITDEDVMPYFSVLAADDLSNRPIATEADLIAAAAPPSSYSMGEARAFFEVLDDDEHEDSHIAGLCKICNGEHYSVAEREQIRKEELLEFETEWDPTIRL